MAGRFIKNNDLYESEKVGEMRSDGVDFEMHLRKRDKSPIIVNTKNGSRFYFQWDELLMQALEAGVSEEK